MRKPKKENPSSEETSFDDIFKSLNNRLNDPNHPLSVLKSIIANTVDPDDIADESAITPKHITDRVLEICKEIDPNSKSPLFYSVPPAPPVPSTRKGAMQLMKADDPFDPMKQVQKKIARDGGSSQFGWLIWQHKYFWDFQPHMQWVDSNEEQHDVTPQIDDQDGKEQVLFLADTMRVWSKDFPEQNKLFHLRPINMKKKKFNKKEQRLLDLLKIYNQLNCIRARPGYTWNNVTIDERDNQDRLSRQAVKILKQLDGKSRKGVRTGRIGKTG